MQRFLSRLQVLCAPESLAARFAIVVFSLLLLFFRLPESFTAPQLVLSDGPVFLLLAQQEGLSSLFRPQAGYFHIFPRAILLLASWLPGYEAIVFTYAAHLALILLLFLILSPHTPLRCKLPACLALVLLPPKAYWVHGSAINVVWLLALIIPLVLLRRLPGRLPLSEALLLLLASLSTPIILWCLPFFYLRMRQERDSQSRRLWYLALGSWLLQCGALLTSYQSRAQRSVARFDFDAWAQVFFSFAASPFFNGAIITELALSLGILLCLLYLFLVVRSWQEGDTASSSMMSIALLSFLPPILSFHASPRELYWHEDRYTYLSAVLILWVVLQHVVKRGKGQLIYALLLAIASISALGYFDPGTPAMFETSCPKDSLVGPLKCEGKLRFRWYRESP